MVHFSIIIRYIIQLLDAYRNGTYNREDVLNDIIQTSLLIAKREKNKKEPYLSNFKEIKKGLLQFKQYQMTSFFRIDEAIVASAKAAYVAARINADIYGDLEVFQKGYNKQDFLIHNPKYIFLNKLQPEALFYWFKSLEIIDNQL